MSTYEDYTRTSASYDATRTANGYEIWLGHLLVSGRSLQSLRLLDSGCGTGNYSAALAPHMGHITAIDLNQAMLDQARQKIVTHQLSERVQFEQGSILDLPFEDGTFDAAMFNQVLHHLDRPGDSQYSGCEQAISEAARVLRPGGLLLINACSRKQLGSGFWYYHLAPNALKTVINQQIPSSRLTAILEAHGFSVTSRSVPLDATLMADSAYFDATGPLRDQWRAGDSFWALADRNELRNALDTVRRLDAENRLQQFLDTHDAERPHIGQMTFWVGLKSGS